MSMNECGCVCGCECWIQQARRWPVPALAMVPRRGVAAVSIAAVSTFFFLQLFSFSSASIPVVFPFSSFEGIYFG